MRTVVAKDGDMLDQIWFQITGSQEGLDAMIDANGHLANKYELEAGDAVNIPEVSTQRWPKSVPRLYGN